MWLCLTPICDFPNTLCCSSPSPVHCIPSTIHPHSPHLLKIRKTGGFVSVHLAQLAETAASSHEQTCHLCTSSPSLRVAEDSICAGGGFRLPSRICGKCCLDRCGWLFMPALLPDTPRLGVGSVVSMLASSRYRVVYGHGHCFLSKCNRWCPSEGGLLFNEGIQTRPRGHTVEWAHKAAGDAEKLLGEGHQKLADDQANLGVNMDENY
ncbi:unnamed protein product, partial [Rhizoctonia solani]